MVEKHHILDMILMVLWFGMVKDVNQYLQLKKKKREMEELLKEYRNEGVNNEEIERCVIDIEQE